MQLASASCRFFFFFSSRRRHTRWTGDWSSDVCSSDLAAGWLWRRGVPRRWWGIAAATLLVLWAPYAVRYFGRGIAPPAAGVSLGLWLSWQTALAVTAMAIILLAAALVRGSTEPTRVSWALPAACAWGALSAIGGLWLWDPHGAWPEWYTFLWLPALA